MNMAITNAHGEIEKAGCLVRDNRGRVLLVIDPRGHHAFPKGHCEADETGRQTAARETLEETGWVVTLGKRLPDLRYRNPKFDVLVRVKMYAATPVSTVADGCLQSVWADVDAAPELLGRWGERMHPLGRAASWLAEVLAIT
jgi:8-oxo-dGTP pyrophosphatase MutT (NUDIX family)